MGARQGTVHGRRGPTDEALDSAVRAFARSNSYVRTAEALGVDVSTLRRWRQDPEFQARFDEAERRHDRKIGRLAKSVLEQRLTDMLERRSPTEEVVLQKSGAVVERKLAADYDVATIRTALTKLDPSWTHPKQEVEHSGALTLEQSVSEAAQRMAEDGD